MSKLLPYFKAGCWSSFVRHAKRQNISSISISSFTVSQPRKGERRIHGEGQNWLERRISLELWVCCICLSYFLVRMMETLSPHLKSREEQQSKSLNIFSGTWKTQGLLSEINLKKIVARGWLEHLVWWQNEIEQFKGERDANVFPWTKGGNCKGIQLLIPWSLLILWRV